MRDAADDDPLVTRAARDLARTPAPDERAVERVLAAVRAAPAPQRRAGREGGAHFLSGTFGLSPLAGAAAAAALIALGAAIGGALQRERVVGSAVQAGRLTSVSPSDTLRAVQFLLAAPGAGAVSLVGDFNGWDVGATPMRRAPDGGMWMAEMRLPAGRHVYSFVVDGSRWLPDPLAPLAADDGFGVPSSVLVVDGAPST